MERDGDRVKVRATANLWGLSYGREQGLTRGEVVDLPCDLAAEAVRRGHATLALSGDLPRPGFPSHETLTELAVALAAEQPGPISELRNRIKGGGRDAAG